MLHIQIYIYIYIHTYAHIYIYIYVRWTFRVYVRFCPSFPIKTHNAPSSTTTTGRTTTVTESHDVGNEDVDYEMTRENLEMERLAVL